MLKHIHISNFAIIDDLELEFSKGMTAITGETGAGKSIIIDAIEIALGQRANSDLIRHGAKRAEICLSFDISKHPETLAWLQKHELDEENECIVRRTLSLDGRSKSYINGTPVNIAPLKTFAEKLINIHGQHEFQSLLKPDLQRKLLDGFAKHQKLLDKVATNYYAWQDLHFQYETLKDKEHEAKSRAEYLGYQLEELDNLSFTKKELSELENKHKTLANADDVLTHCQEASKLLNENDNAGIQQLNVVAQELEKLIKFAPELKNTQELVNSAMIASEEAYAELQHYLNKLELDPEQLQHIENRLSKAHDLARKHHIEMITIPEFHHQLQNEYEQLANCDEHLEKLKTSLDETEKAYFTDANKLTKSRLKSAKQLSALITENIQQLGMPGGKVQIDLQTFDDKKPRVHGLEKMSFLVTANPGQPLQPLTKVASGGELSRISLAIQVITSKFTETPSLVFDEVDVGIGGATADIVGNLLQKLSASAQVLCITHLAQVASKAHQHLQVSKKTDGKTTSSQIAELDAMKRIHEIARMAGGVKITDETLAHAKAMLAG
jgi:DNA repair protein RecN (Recombination protein N)